MQLSFRYYSWLYLPKCALFVISLIYRDYLCEEEFVDYLYKLYMGSFEETVKIIFDILDYDQDGILIKDEIKIFLSYLPLDEVDEDCQLDIKADKKKINKIISTVNEKQKKSLEEIDNMVNEAFEICDEIMDLENFTQMIKGDNSEIFLQILCFLYDQMPFSAENVEAVKNKYNQIKEEDLIIMAEDYRQRTKKSGSIRIKTPKQNTLLSPAGVFLKKCRVRKFSLNENETYFGEFRLSDKSNKKLSLDTTKASDNNGLSRKPSKSISPKMQKNLILDLGNKKINNDPYNKNIDIVRLDNDNYIEKNNQMEIEENMDIKQLVKNSRQGYTSPTKYLQDKSYINHLAVNNKNYFNIGTQLRPIKEYDDENENKINEKMEMNVIFNSNDNVTYANWVYKLTETGKMRKFYLVLVNKDIYYYKSDSKKDFVGMHNLSGCFVQECTEVKNFEGKDYYSFEIYCKNKSKLRKYFAENESICKDFVQQIKKAIGYVKFSDLYEMKEVIGKGKFGVVNLGIHKKTGQQVAIKILNKENIKTLEDKELVQIEIGILKLCHHPNIVRLLDHLENNDYIYIVTEYNRRRYIGSILQKKEIQFQ